MRLYLFPDVRYCDATDAPEDIKAPTKPAEKQSKPAENGTPLVVVIIIAVACVALGAGVTFFLVTKKKR